MNFLIRIFLLLFLSQTVMADAFAESSSITQKNNLPRDEINICETVADLANTNQLGKYIVNEAKNIEYEGRKIDLEFTTQGSAFVPQIYDYDSKTHKQLDNFDMPSPLYVRAEYPGEEDNIGLFKFKGKFSIIYYKDTQHPVSVIPIGQGATCSFTSNFEETVGANVIEPAMCNKLINGRRS